MAAVVPPPYEPHSSPPSYDELVDRVTEMVGPDPTPQKLLDATDKLTAEELNILMNEGDHSDFIENEEDNKIFCTGAAEAITSPEGDKYMNEAADDAVKAVVDIRDMFRGLQLDIANIDRIHNSGFQPQLLDHQRKFERVLTDSRNLASDIAVHGNRFQTRIIPFCFDDRITTEQRLTVLHDFISQMNRTQSDSREMETRLAELQRDFTSFVATFGDWAKEREGEITVELEAVAKQLIELNEELAKVTIAMASLGGGSLALAFLSKALVGLSFLGPFALIAGAIAKGLSIAAYLSFLALMMVRINLKHQIGAAERRQTRLQEELDLILKAREGLVALGDNNIKRFDGNVDMISGVWNTVAIDARAIEQYLNGALLFVNLPEWMKDDLTDANTIYMRMAEYLNRYARGITS